MTSTPLARRLMQPRARLQVLMEEIGKLEARANRAAPIAVLRVARCGHGECGCNPPAEMPSDALVIEMGCLYQIPDCEPPEGHVDGYQSRVERMPEIGRGLGEEGVRQALQMIRTLNR